MTVLEFVCPIAAEIRAFLLLSDEVDRLHWEVSFFDLAFENWSHTGRPVRGGMDGRNPSCSLIGCFLVQSLARVLYNLSFGRKSYLLNDEIDLWILGKLNEKRKRMFVWLIHFGSLEDEMNLIGSSYLFSYLLLSNNPRNMFRCLSSDSNASFPFDLFQILD